MKKYLFILSILLLNIRGTYSQSVAINTDGSKPNPNAIVDVKSTTKGVLLPRMTTAERHKIPNTRGLMVYDTDENLFWYNDGASWQSIYTTDLFKKNGTAWLLTGNSHTQDKSNFIGTKDNEPLNFRVNNQRSGRIDSASGNTFWGYQAGNSDTIAARDIGIGNTAVGTMALFTNVGANYNTAFGLQALYSNTIGGFNTATGTTALSSNTTGGDNTATGGDALAANTTGYNNTGTGLWALRYNSSGDNNTATGSGALSFSTTGSNNTANGYGAMGFNITGSNNTSNGFSALFNNISGDNNTANGTYALISNKTGYSNTADGNYALLSNYSGNNLTGLGERADVSVDGLNNATAIGAGAIVDASNKVRIGNTSITVIEGQVPFTTPSDGRFKFNIKENVRGLDFILKLRPVTYQFDVKKQEGFTRGTIKPGELNNYVTTAGNDEATQMIRTGLIAQEVEQAARKAGYDFDGVKAPKTEREYYSLSYSSFVVPLVKAVQEQQQIIYSQQQKMDEQNARIAKLEDALAEVNKTLKSLH